MSRRLAVTTRADSEIGMNVLSSLNAVFPPLLPIAVIALGLFQLWRGLSGQPTGEGRLVRRQSLALGRM